jgi:hypothetical protein
METQNQLKDSYDYENEPFSIQWLKENIDWGKFYELGDMGHGNDVEMIIVDVFVKDGKESGVIDISYCGNFYITVGKGLDSLAWLVSGDRYFRNDTWLPVVKTMGDFKRLFRVVTGFALPLKQNND